MTINESTTVGEVVKINTKTAQLFENYKIDFCCGGNITIAEACRKFKLDPNLLLSEIELILQIPDSNSTYIDSLNLAELCDYIEKRHHSYINHTTPFLQEKLNKICEVHGNIHPELYKIRDLFEKSIDNLTVHMKNEELVLFPAIRRLKVNNENKEMSSNKADEVKKLIEKLHDEHIIEGERFVQISDLTNNYTAPEDACNTYKVTFQTLKEFEEDLHIHIHTENNILFKKIID